MYPPSGTSLPSPTLLHPSILSQSWGLRFLSHPANFHWLIFYIGWCVCFHATLHLSHSLLPTHCPHHVHKFVLYVCISTAALQIGSSVPSFYIPLLLFSHSVVSNSATLWTAVCQASLSYLLQFAQTVCRSLLLSLIFPGIRVFFSESALCIR